MNTSVRFGLSSLILLLQFQFGWSEEKWRWKTIPDFSEYDRSTCKSLEKPKYDTFEMEVGYWYEGACRLTKMSLPVDSQLFKVTINYAGIELMDWDSRKAYTVQIEYVDSSYEYCRESGLCSEYSEFIPQSMFKNLGSSKFAYTMGTPELHVVIEKKFGNLHFVLSRPFENAVFFLSQLQIESKIIGRDSEHCHYC